MNDRELLELAAKAAGISLSYWCPTNNAFWCGAYWNPLTDDGDALRLAVSLRMGIDIANNWPEYATAWSVPAGTVENGFDEHFDSDPYAATRRAIVRAAAEIGKESK